MKGWREWSLVETPDGWRLKGAFGRTWQSSLAKADSPPEEGNTHGIYAYNAIERVLNDSIFGEVELGGKIVVHSDGRIRAEYARILYLVVSDVGNIEKLLRYCVPITKLSIGEVISNYLNNWLEMNISLLNLAQPTLEPKDYLTPETPRQMPLEVDLPINLSAEGLKKLLDNFIRNRGKRKAYNAMRSAAIRDGTWKPTKMKRGNL